MWNMPIMATDLKKMAKKAIAIAEEVNKNVHGQRGETIVTAHIAGVILASALALGGYGHHVDAILQDD